MYCQNRRLCASLFIDDLGSAHTFKNRIEKTTQKGERGGLFDSICMGSSMEELSPPEMMNWMHADLKIEVEKRLLINDLKTLVWHTQGSILRIQKTIVLPVPSGFRSTAPNNINYIIKLLRGNVLIVTL